MAENKGYGNKGASQDGGLDDLNADNGINQGQKSGRHPQGSEQSGQQGSRQSGRDPQGSEPAAGQQESGRHPQGSVQSGQQSQQSGRQGSQQSGGRNLSDDLGSPQTQADPSKDLVSAAGQGQREGNQQSGGMQSGNQQSDQQQGGRQQGNQQHGGQHASGGTPALDDLSGKNQNRTARQASDAFDQQNNQGSGNR